MIRWLRASLRTSSARSRWGPGTPGTTVGASGGQRRRRPARPPARGRPATSRRGRPSGRRSSPPRHPASRSASSGSASTRPRSARSPSRRAGPASGAVPGPPRRRTSRRTLRNCPPRSRARPRRCPGAIRFESPSPSRPSVRHRWPFAIFVASGRPRSRHIATIPTAGPSASSQNASRHVAAVRRDRAGRRRGS